MLVKGVQRYLQVSKNKKVVFAMGRLLRYFHPGELLEMLKLLEFDITAIVIIEEAYNAKERQEVKELLSGLIEVPIYEMKDQRVEAALQEAELVITTHELQLGKKKQIFVPMLPKIGVKGLLNFMEVIYRLLCSKISNGGVTYVRN